jgi:hypothetical protein
MIRELNEEFEYWYGYIATDGFIQIKFLIEAPGKTSTQEVMV